MDMVKIGKFLSQLRKERGLTQEQLGQQLGVSNKTISRWETGTYLPPVEMLQLLSKSYGVTINEILSGERLDALAYREKAEENMKSVLSESPFTLDERIEYYQSKWRKDHFWTRLTARVMIGCLLVVGIFRKEVLWSAAYAAASLIYYCVERNRMMAYVEARAFDGSGPRNEM